MQKQQDWDKMLLNMEATKAELYPISPIDDKNNTKKFLRIERDGSVTARVFLDIFEMDIREQVICLHYLRHRIQHFYDEEVGVNFMSRDDPWDFGIELSTKESFNVEITSIADSEDHFKITKREERLTHYSSFEKLPLHEVKKLAALFGDETIDELVNELSTGFKQSSDEVQNPFYSQSGRVIVSSMLNPVEKLSDQIKRAVNSKASKNHLDKEKTVLILDNRSSAYDAPDYRKAVSELEEYWTDCPFPEIWFYTGYYSDTDGMNAEFSFAPLNIPDRQLDKLEQKYNRQLKERNSDTLVW